MMSNPDSQVKPMIRQLLRLSRNDRLKIMVCPGRSQVFLIISQQERSLLIEIVNDTKSYKAYSVYPQPQKSVLGHPHWNVFALVREPECRLVFLVPRLWWLPAKLIYQEAHHHVQD